MLLQEDSISDDADQIPANVGPPVTKPGDLWLLGDNRVICGDARDGSCMATLMDKRQAAAVLADPPYSVVIDGHATGNGSVRHPEFAMASGEMSEAEFVAFLSSVFGQLTAWSTNGSIHYLCMDWRHMSEILAAGKKAYDTLLNVCVWAKDSGGMGSFYRSQHEMIFVFRNGKAPHLNNVQLGKFGRYRTNVWNYPGANGLSCSGTEGNLLQMHPPVKPVALIADAILDCSTRGSIVLNPFLGSGTSLLACERVGRLCYAAEIEPKYVDLAVRRWQQYTGGSAIHATTEELFDERAGKENSDNER